MKLFSSETAASEVIGHLLILFITILGVGMITLYGLPAIYSLEDIANSKNSEQAFTVLDSRASRVTLGESPLQVTNINLGGGTLTVEPNSTINPSFMFVNSSNFNITIPMGRVKYILGDRIVAYEGGGVWAQYPGGGTVMLSPPEIHYNGWTLTLPVININGSASIGGKGTAVVSFKKVATIIQYPNASFAGRMNPVNGSKTGKVNLNITSDYYKAWADYARTLSYTNVSVNDKNKTTIIELEVISPMGTFTSIPGTITMRDINMSNPTPLTNFSFNLVYGSGCGNGVRNWNIISNGVPTLTISIDADGSCKATVKIKYEGQGVEEEWDSSSPIQLSPHDTQMNLDLLSKSMMLTYDGSTCLTWTTCTTPNSSYNILEHYAILIGPDIIFTPACDRQNCHMDPVSSSFTLYYDPGPGALTYLLVTENKADVGIS